MRILKSTKQEKNILKKAVNQNDVNALMNVPIYNENWDSGILKYEISNIRKILGNMINTLNNFSSIYKSFMENRDVSNTNVQQLISDLKNLDSIKLKMSEINNTYVKNIKQKNLKQADKINNFYDSYLYKQIYNIAKVVENQITYIASIRFNEEQTKNILNMAIGTKNEKPKRVEEINLERMNQFLNASVYSIGNESKKTLKVIREILQNACDAVNKKHETGGEIRLYSSSTDDNNMDLIIEDNGIGMDWQTLSNNFFVYFSSGKSNDPTATGGFGIAKALIQETPKEGWSLETNDIHSSKYNKNMFFADQENYQYPKLEGNSIGGLKLTLYSIPIVTDSEIKNLASKYSSISTLTIFINDIPVAPLFTTESLKKINQNEDIAELVGDTTQEKDMIKSGLSLLLKNQVGSLSFSENGTQTTVDFFMNKKEVSEKFGNFYIFLNGQYQFEKSPYPYLQRFDIICSIKTNSRPGTNEYPVDPGRENLKEPYKTPIYEIESEVKESITKIFENELFKEGLDIDIYNKDKDGINFEENKEKQNLSVVEDSLMNALYAVNTEPEKQKEFDNLVNKLTSWGPVETSVSESEKQEQKNIVNAIISKARQETEGKIDIKQLAEDIITGIDTQYAFIVQKKYVSRERIQNKKYLTSNLTIVWNKVLKILGKRIMQSRLKYSLSDKKIVGGVIYSNECLGLSIPPKGDRRSYLTLINPVNSAAIIESEIYESQILDSDVQEVQTGIKDETPTNKFTNFIYHIATHELAHAMFPSSYKGNLEDWHSNLSIIEILCQSEYNKIRDVVKEYMQPLRKDMKQLITMIKKEKAQKAKISSNKLNNINKLVFNRKKFNT